MKLWDSVCNVRKRLDDYPAVGSASVWSHDEIELYLQDGYDAFCRQTRAVFDFFYPENLPQTGNHCGEWEEDYFESGMIRTGLANFTGGRWETDYAEAGAIGPRNLTQPWEGEYALHIFPVSLLEVPEDNVTVERATYDMRRLEPEYTAWFQEQDRDFQTTSGTPSRFTMDKDGVSRMRVVPAGDGGADGGDPRLFPSIRAHWPLQEVSDTRYDLNGSYLSVHGLHPFRDETGIATTAGPLGSAALFVRSHQDYMEAPSIDISGTHGFAVTFWVKLTSAVNFEHLLMMDDGVSDRCLSIWSGSGRQLSALVWDDAGNSAGATIDTALRTAIWTFCCVQWDPSDGMLFIQSYNTDANGTAQSPEVLTNIAATSQPFRAGWAYTATNYLNGALSGVTVWDEPLSDTFRTWLINSGTERPFPFTYTLDARIEPARRFGNFGFGLLRQATDADNLGDWSPMGSWGALREPPEHFAMGGQWGIPRRLYSDEANVRVEYSRLGHSLEEYPYEVPERFAKYVEYYAAAKALEREGPGQDMKLSAHFMGRYQEGVDRMTKRLSENKRSRVSKVGSTGKGPQRPALARLPWRYGRQIRYGY